MARFTTGAAYAAAKYIELPVRREAQLLPFIMEQMSGTSRNRAKDLLAGHAVTVDRKLVTRHDYELQVGQVVHITRHKRGSELTNKLVKIVYEDKDIVVVEKQEGILSMGASPRVYCVKTVLDEYFRRRHFKCTAHVVHRLDRDTSGLMMYAKSMEVRRTLEEHWREMVYDRRYVAVLCGRVEREGGTLRSWMHDDKQFLTHSTPEPVEGSREAVTHFHTLRTTERFSLVELKLETGRKNQIRVHAQEMGHPVVGDRKYGHAPDVIGRLALHAYRLHFYHPVTGEAMTFETPFPTKFTRLLEE